eukprot:CAMPEP_0173192814 /NCGR_PEP_ID=MMETSP1141-20130122/13621_1 /TAXON_ID=483371 /ORGANISM="non described non described, Strain CCMP2298" /LENGTH=97 /DNA_ID=CAMNT_0014117099 /DNA_START=480 /DNA_END=773 /DNA_ORIENTATION=+
MVAAELNLLDAANLTPASVSPITCLPNEVVFWGQRKSLPPLEKSTMDLAGKREVTGCSRPTKVGLCLAVLVFLPGAPVSSMVVMTEVIEDQKEVEIR